MKIFVLVLTYTLGSGDIDTNLSVHDSIAECEYTAAIIENDHAYLPRNNLLAAQCKRYEFSFGDVWNILRR